MTAVKGGGDANMSAMITNASDIEIIRPTSLQCEDWGRKEEMISDPSLIETSSEILSSRWLAGGGEAYYRILPFRCSYHFRSRQHRRKACDQLGLVGRTR